MERMPREKKDNVLVMSCESDRESCKRVIEDGIPIHSAELLHMTLGDRDLLCISCPIYYYYLSCILVLAQRFHVCWHFAQEVSLHAWLLYACDVNEAIVNKSLKPHCVMDCLVMFLQNHVRVFENTSLTGLTDVPSRYKLRLSGFWSGGCLPFTKHQLLLLAQGFHVFYICDVTCIRKNISTKSEICWRRGVKIKEQISIHYVCCVLRAFHSINSFFLVANNLLNEIRYSHGIAKILKLFGSNRIVSRNIKRFEDSISVIPFDRQNL